MKTNMACLGTSRLAGRLPCASGLVRRRIGSALGALLLISGCAAVDPKSVGEAAAKAACRELVMRYALLRDQKATAAYVDLFTSDAVLIINGAQTTGHAQLLERLATGQATPQTTHLMSSVVIESVSPTDARGTSYVSVYVHDSPGNDEPHDPAEGALAGTGRLVAVGEYQDHFKRTSTGWKIARRVFVTRLQPGS